MVRSPRSTRASAVDLLRTARAASDSDFASFAGSRRSPRASALELLRTKRSVADYDYYADQDKYVSRDEVEREARRLVAEIMADKARTRASAVRSRFAPPRDAVEELDRLTMTPEKRKQMAEVRRMFGNLDISDEVVQKLEGLEKEVVPVKYYECPAEWNEYTDVTKDQIQKAGVVWQNARGNFCLPPSVKGNPDDRVDSSEFNRLPSEAAVRRQVNNQLRQLRQLQETPEERSKRLAAEARAQQSRTARQTRAVAMETKRKTIMKEKMKEQEVRNLMQILQDLPNGRYASMTVDQLRAKAEELYGEASTCADLSGQTKGTCEADAKCSYGVGGSCYPKGWASQAKQELEAIRRSNKSGVPLSRSEAEAYAENEAMVEWWQDYYPRVRAFQKVEKAKTYDEDSIVRSLMSAN